MLAKTPPSDFKSWYSDKVMDGYYTPDGIDIARHTHHLVLAYGTLRMGQPRNSILTTSGKNKLVAFGATSNSNLSLMYSFKAGFPAAFLHDEGTPDTGRVFGEVWKVTEAMLRNLDRIESNQHLFRRIQVGIDVATGSGLETIPNVWMYFGVPKYLKNAGNWYNLEESHSSVFGKYYTYLQRIKLKGLKGEVKTTD